MKRGRLRHDLSDALTEVIEEINEIKATGPQLVRLSALVERLTAARAEIGIVTEPQQNIVWGSSPLQFREEGV
jgi:hypothetical protein